MATQFPRAASPSNNRWFSPWADQPQHLATGNLPFCDDDCTLHSPAIHDAVRVIVHHFDIPEKFLDGHWNPVNVDDVLAYGQAASPGNPWPIGGPTEELRHLPMAPTRQNGELLRICTCTRVHKTEKTFDLRVAANSCIVLKLLCRFKASLDGNPEPNHPIIKQYVPTCIQDPLLLQIVLYTSACFLGETGHVPRMIVMAHKGRAISMLNEHLRSDTFKTSDAAIAGVVQLIIDEWYWGETGDLRAHLRGLREMVRMRGGFHRLGMNGLLAKMIIL
jgi:hypothetical protein